MKRFLSFFLVLLLTVACGKKSSDSDFQRTRGGRYRPAPSNPTVEFQVKNPRPIDVNWDNEKSQCNSFLQSVVIAGALWPYAPTNAQIDGYCSCSFNLISYGTYNYNEYNSNPQGVVNNLSGFLQANCDDSANGLITSNLKTYIFK